MPVADYYNRVNRDLLTLIPPDAKVVLEIGCGAGALCEAYRRINPGVEWNAVEPNPGAAEAASRSARVIRDHVENIEWQLSLCESCDDIDCLIMGDVLEHLEDPWSVLKMLANYLSPGAQVLASIPNAQHYTLIYALLTGTFDYADEGLTDRTHLRWFTIDTIRTMFADACLQIHEIRGIKGSLNGASDESQWDKFVRFIGSVPNLDLKRMRPLQYLMRAVKPPAKITPLHIHAVTAEECCTRPRIREPFAMMATVPGVRCTTREINWPTYPPDTHILIEQRFREVDFVYHQSAIERGAILIAELDDLPEAIGMDPLYLRAVHAVQVSTEALAEIVREYNPNVMVFENQIAELPPPKERKLGERVMIFYGAQNREADWAPIMPALNRALKDHPEVGVCVVHDKAFFDALEIKHGDQKGFHPFCEYQQYRRLLGLCDIALLPLEPGRFNACKSDLKFLECAAEGVTVLGSDTAIGHLWCRYPEGPQAACYVGRDGFESGLRALIEKPDLRRAAAERAYTYVRDHRLLSQHYRKRLDWYRDLMTKRALLNRQLLDRCPELCRSSEPELARLAP